MSTVVRVCSSTCKDSFYIAFVEAGLGGLRFLRWRSLQPESASPVGNAQLIGFMTSYSVLPVSKAPETERRVTNLDKLVTTISLTTATNRFPVFSSRNQISSRSYTVYVYIYMSPSLKPSS